MSILPPCIYLCAPFTFRASTWQVPRVCSSLWGCKGDILYPSSFCKAISYYWILSKVSVERWTK